MNCNKGSSRNQPICKAAAQESRSWPCVNGWSLNPSRVTCDPALACFKSGFVYSCLGLKVYGILYGICICLHVFTYTGHLSWFTGYSIGIKSLLFQYFQSHILSWMFWSFNSVLSGLTPCHKYIACAGHPICLCDCYRFNSCRSQRCGKSARLRGYRNHCRS